MFNIKMSISKYQFAKHNSITIIYVGAVIHRHVWLDLYILNYG